MGALISVCNEDSSTLLIDIILDQQITHSTFNINEGFLSEQTLQIATRVTALVPFAGHI